MQLSVLPEDGQNRLQLRRITGCQSQSTVKSFARPLQAASHPPEPRASLLPKPPQTSKMTFPKHAGLATSSPFLVRDRSSCETNCLCVAEGPLRERFAALHMSSLPQLQMRLSASASSAMKVPAVYAPAVEDTLPSSPPYVSTQMPAPWVYKRAYQGSGKTAEEAGEILSMITEEQAEAAVPFLERVCRQQRQQQTGLNACSKA